MHPATRLMIDLFAPTAANTVEPAGANWQAVPLEWLLRAARRRPAATTSHAGGPHSHALGHGVAQAAVETEKVNA